MGKPYIQEIDTLEETYRWALHLDITALAKNIASFWSIPLLSVGSGGSFSAAEYQAHLHRVFFASTSQAVTPVEMLSTLPKNKEASVWFITAGGNNIDIYRGLQHACLNEMRNINALVGSDNTKLHRLSKKYQYANLWGFPLPTGKDGFLATNSLLAFSVLLYRAYSTAVKQHNGLPNKLSILIENTINHADFLSTIEKRLAPIWKCSVLHVLFSPGLKAAALDIESKFIEAGLMSVHLADIRNFAHGRHHWFAKNTEHSGIIALSNQAEKDLAIKTLSLLPVEIPKEVITFKGIDSLNGIAGLVLSLYFTLWLGEERGIDPGRPGVPDYGSKIYRLTTNPGFVTSINKKTAAINRKKRWLTVKLDTEHDEQWRKAYSEFVRKLESCEIGGIVLDYDGTCVDNQKRWSPPTDEFSQELSRLLDEGIHIGFATGRGKSIRTDLQKVIPERHWKSVIIGYYNGSELRELSDNAMLESASSACESLAQIEIILGNNIFLSTLSEFETRKYQLTVKGKETLSEDFLWDVVQDELYKHVHHKGEVLCSSHSVDIITDNVSKLSVVRHIEALIPENKKILNIGDRGKWPGNDALLLKEPLSLSVDQVSYAHDCCWNLCPAGITGAQGALYYLTRLRRKNGSIRFYA
jgi:hydroxymethylpyrimidine pyrophosphatase-like HAD family hydrolase